MKKEEGVVAFSAGNHSQAIALASRMLHISATIVMPCDAPSVKIEATQGYGGCLLNTYALSLES